MCSNKTNTIAPLLLVAACLVTHALCDVSAGVNVLRKLFDQCENWQDSFKCIKVQALKVADRAMSSKSFGIVPGVNVIQTAQNDTSGRHFSGSNRKLLLSEEKLERLDTNHVNKLLLEASQRFLETHRVQIDMPKLIEEGRGKMKKYMGPMIAALMIKGGFMAVAMKGIAAMAGTALLIGKMALLLSAILGLKKLVSGGGGESKTTFEIVKHPEHYSKNTYSGGHYGGYDDAGGPYHRSLKDAEEMVMQERQDMAYRAQILKR